MSAEAIYSRHIMLFEYRKFGNADLVIKNTSEFDKNGLRLCPYIGNLNKFKRKLLLKKQMA